MAFLRTSKDRELDRMLNADLNEIEDRYQDEMRAADNPSWRELDEMDTRRSTAEIEAYKRHEARVAEWQAQVAAFVEADE